MTHEHLRGVIAAIATPVTAEGAPDLPRFVALARWLLDEGCDGLNVLGTTGEATSFSLKQRMSLMEGVARSGLPLPRLMVGTGAAAVADAAALTKHAAELGFAAGLVVPPFYFKGVPDEGVVRYFDQIASASGELPLFLYHFPAVSGVPYALPLIAKLRTAFGARIVGLKDSSGDMAYARSVAALGDGFKVFPSTEACLLDAREGVFAGCVSATANINAAWCARAFRQGDAAAHATAVAMRKLFDGKALVPGVKGLLAELRGDGDMAAVQPPYVALSAPERSALAAAHAALASSATERAVA